MMDAREASPWSADEVVAAFARSAPNATLMRVAAAERGVGTRVLDIGCGAARNALPLAAAGWEVVGLDLSWPMLRAAARRIDQELPRGRVQLVLAPMDDLPLCSGSIDLVVAHGTWNLARSTAQFRRAVREAARVARHGAALFVFTFSRTTLAPDAQPVAGQPFVFMDFSGAPQCFLTEEQLLTELAAAGFQPDGAVPLRELNIPPPGALRTGPHKVIYEGTFRRTRSW